MKNSNDKYYTPENTVKKTMEILRRYFKMEDISEIIEPAAGDGAFIEEIKKLNIDYKFYDLYPEHPEVEEMDFKKLKLEYKPGRIFVGNPPFGHASSLFKRFVKGACEMGDGAVYVGPASHWNAKWGWRGLKLVYSEHLGEVEYYTSEGNGESKRVNTCLNVYMRGEEEGEDRMDRLDKDVKIIGRLTRQTPSDADFFLRTIASGARKGCGMYDEERRYAVNTAFKVLNPEVYDRIKEFCETFYERYGDDLLGSTVSGKVFMNIPFVKQKLAEWLYPTREERLDRDFYIRVSMKRNGKDFYDYNDGDFYISRYGNGSLGEYHRERRVGCYISIKVLNKIYWNKTEEFCKEFGSKYKDDIKKSTETNGLKLEFFKQKLAEHLYS